MKSQQTTNALTFLTHIILAIGGVYSFWDAKFFPGNKHIADRVLTASRHTEKNCVCGQRKKSQGKKGQANSTSGVEQYDMDTVFKNKAL